MIETVVCTLDISNSFTEFADRFDHEEAAGREAKGIKVLYRGVCRENPSKVVIIVQAETVCDFKTYARKHFAVHA